MIWGTATLLIAAVALAAFAIAFHFSGLVAQVRSVARTIRAAVAVFADDTLADTAKENVLRRSALQLFAHTARMGLTTALVLAIPGAVLWVGDVTGYAPLADSWALLSSWEAIFCCTAAVVAFVFLGNRR